jgi:hypothetical protein
LIALGLVALIAWKAIPVKIQSSELYDYMDELAKFNSERTPPEDLMKMIMARAHGLGIPIEKGDIKVERNGDRIFMEVDYTVPLDILGMVYRWHFHQKLDRPIFIV